MDIGRLRHRITLENYKLVQDGIGVERKQWHSLVTVWASVEPLSGREYFATAAEKGEVTARITIRYQKNISPTMRVRFGERLFEVVSVINPQEKNIQLILMCKEIVPGG